MRKFLNLLLFMSVMTALTSCHDDDNIPQVTFNVNYEGAIKTDGVFYVVRGDVFTITSVTVTPVDGTERAELGPVTYAWDYGVLGTNFISPYGLSIDTSVEPLGNHLLQLTATVIQEGKSLGQAAIGLPVKIVASPEDIPGYTPDTPSTGETRAAGIFAE